MEPDVENPPVRVWRDWLLVAGVAGTTMAEAVVRDGMVSRPVAIVFGVTLALTMLWRRTQPLAMVGLGFGALVVVDVASVVAVGEPFYPYAGAFVVVLVYSLFRWGTNRQAAIGFVIVLLEWLVSVTTDFTGVADASGGLVVLLFAAALGVSIRYRRIVVTQQFERVRFHEREMLARELHDTVAHHVSAIAIQAQAGQFLAKSRDLGGAAEALEVIEEEASRTLAEMRSMVGSFAGATAPRGCSPSVALPTSKVWPPPKEPRTCRSMSSTAAISTICDPRSRQRCIGLPRSRSPTQSVTHGTQPGSTSSWPATPRPYG